MTYEEKNKVLLERQKPMPEAFQEKGTISKPRYEKSMHDLIEKMNAGEK